MLCNTKLCHKIITDKELDEKNMKSLIQANK